MATEWNEFNKLNVSEFSSIAPEWTELISNKAPMEWKESPDNSVTGKKKKKSKIQDFALKLITTSLVATTAVVGVSVQANAVEVELVELEAYKTALHYQIDVESTDSELVLIVKNNFTNREIPLTAGINSGEIVDLAADMTYTLIVQNRTGITTTIESYTVRTLKEDPPVTQFYDLTYTAAENATGVFTFTPNFIDQKGVWSNISAELIDGCGYGSLRMNIEDAGGMYEMNLGETQFITSKGSLSLWADVLQENGETVREKIYEQDVDLMQTRTYIQSVTFTPVDAWAQEAIVYVEYIDENGFWMDGVVYGTLNGTGDTQLVGTFEESGGAAYYPIYEGFCEGNTLLYELSVHIENGEELVEVVIYAEEVVVKSADFDESSGSGTSSDYST